MNKAEYSEWARENALHSDCPIAKGFKFLKCEKCGKDTTNYVNGIDICAECCKEIGICRICGNPLGRD